MQAELEYVSVGCSRTPHAADWSNSNILAYAAHESVALARETEEVRGPVRVFATLHGHRGRVNCVRWLPGVSLSPPVPCELLSGGVDGKVVLWRRGESGEFSMVQELISHTASVTCVAGVYLLLGDREEGETPSIRTLIASGASDSTLKVWERVGINGKFSEVQTVSFGRGFVLCLDLCLLPFASPTEPLLVSGGDNAKVNIYFWRDGKFCLGLSLSGHSDWVRGVEGVRERDDLLLASCSQDHSIRLWRISQQQQQQCKQQQCGKQEDEELRLKGNVFSLESGTTVSVTLESVLIGHDDWVYGVCWWPRNSCHGTDQSDRSSADHLQLLSCSMDKTIILWQPDPSSGVWLEEVRVGEVGGNTLGFYGGLISPRGELIFAHDYQGGLHLWGREERVGGASGLSPDVWSSLPTIGGHFGEVQGLSWEPSRGAFLLSVSSDQTARLHAPWVRTGQERVWFEIARPQIHGYGMTCVAMTTSFQYTSGADEKVLRVFEAPANFLDNLSRISQVNLQKDRGAVPLGASVPSLGLSNKAVFTSEGPREEEKITKNPFADHVPSFQPVDLTDPPVEAHLLQNTLWPESQKLYGHGYEVYCVATSPDGHFIASSCKATKAEHAVIRIWEVSSWKQLQPLGHHTLTITHLTFSHSSHLLLATSRDRTWSLWKLVRTDGNSQFQLSASLSRASKLHSRVIWTAAWSHDDTCFATGSRDKKVLLWQRGGCEGGDGWEVMSPSLEFEQPVTALDFTIFNKRHVLAVGLESGHIHIYYCSLNPLEWNLALSLDSSLAHTATVKQLSWKPQYTEAGQTENQRILASCSHDNCVKLFRIVFCTD